ncbi:MAG: CoA ester lyase [Rhizobiales bacterium]|nr:CoA ester lyase [Hyphomicrobiales bacterium]
MRSLLFVPGDQERKITKALDGDADVVILDLEDSVAPECKQAARALTAEVLSSAQSGPKRYVRVNPLSSGLTAQDLDHVLPAGPDGILQPKTETGDDVISLKNMMKAPLPIIAIATETASAMFGLGNYARAAPDLIAMTWGAEDLSNELGAATSRDEAGHLTDPYRLARSLCLAGARAADVEPVDTVFVDFRDHDGLHNECISAARDGFTAKLAIHPDQVAVINDVFTPSVDALAEANRLIEAFAAAGNPGVIKLDGKMFDIPHLKRAKKLISRAGAIAG